MTEYGDANLPATFWEQVHTVPITGCWLWSGYAAPNGYGMTSSKYAHRLAYERLVGPIPNGLFVLHHCDVRCCVNPQHLYTGTQADNMDDMRRRRRAVALDDRAVQLLLELRSAGWSSTDIAIELEVSGQLVASILAGNPAYPGITDPIPVKQRVRMSLAQRETVRAMLADGLPQRAVAAAFRVSQSTVSGWLHSWAATPASA